MYKRKPKKIEPDLQREDSSSSISTNASQEPQGNNVKLKSPEPSQSLALPSSSGILNEPKKSEGHMKPDPGGKKVDSGSSVASASNLSNLDRNIEASGTSSVKTRESSSDKLPLKATKGVRFSSVVDELPSESSDNEKVSTPSPAPRQKQALRHSIAQPDTQQNDEVRQESRGIKRNVTYETAYPSPLPFSDILDLDSSEPAKAVEIVVDKNTKQPPSILKKRDKKNKNKTVEIPSPPAPPPPLPSSTEEQNGDTKEPSDGVSPLLKGLMFDQNQIKRVTHFSSVDLLNRKRQLKRVAIRDQAKAVSLGRKELVDEEYERLNLELPEYVPLHLVRPIIRDQNVSGDLISLNLNGLDNLTDLTFALLLGRPKGEGKGNKYFRMQKVYIAGCRNFTDQGLIWVSELFPQISMLEINGCKKVTERGFHHLFMNCTKLVNYVAMACNAALIPASIVNTQLPKGSIQWAGNPIITEGKDYYIQYHGAAPEDFFNPMTIKLLIVRDKNLSSTVLPLIKGVQEGNENCRFASTLSFPVPMKDKDETYNFNIMESVNDEPMMQCLVSHGSVIMLAFESPDTEEEMIEVSERLADTVCSILMKSPEICLLMVEFSEAGKSKVYQMMLDRLALMVLGLAEMTYSMYGDHANLEYLDFKGQEGVSRGMSLLDSLDQLLSKDGMEKRMVHLSMNKSEFSTKIVPALTQCAEMVQELVPWVHCDWQVNLTRIIGNLPKCGLSLLSTIFYQTTQEGITHRFSMLRFVKILGLLNLWGSGIVSLNRWNILCSTDLNAFKSIYELINMETPPESVYVESCKATLPCWTKKSLSTHMRQMAITGEASDILMFFKRQGMLIPMNRQHYKKDGLNATVYVHWRDIPHKHDVLPSMWVEPRPKNRVIQTNHVYWILPMAPAGFMAKVIKSLLQIYRPLLIWKTGFLVRQGPVDIKAELLQLEGGNVNKMPALVLSGRIIQIDMDASFEDVADWRQSTDDARSVMFSCMNQIRSVIHYACVKMEVYAVDMMPCPKCARFTTKNMLNVETFKIPYYLGVAFKHRQCKTHKMVNAHFLCNFAIEHNEGLCTPRHNFPYHSAMSTFIHDMVQERRFRPMDPPEKCFYCGRDADIPCLHCSMCSECTRQFTKINKAIQPGNLDPRSFKLQILKEGHFVEEERIKSNTKGCVFYYKKGHCMLFHQALAPFYWDEMDITLLRGSNFLMNLIFASGKKLIYDGWSGKFTDQNGVEKQNDWFKSRDASTVKIRLESVEVGRRVRVIINLAGQDLHKEEVDGWDMKVTLLNQRAGIYIIHTPGLKKSWQLKEQEKFTEGSVLEVALEDGTFHPAIIKERNRNGYLSLDVDGKEHLIIHSSPQLMPCGSTVASGNTLASTLPPASEEGERKQIPLHCFLKFQVPCGFDTLLRLDKTTGEKISGTAFEQIQRKNPRLPDYITPCNVVVLPSVLHARQAQLRDPLEHKFYSSGDLNYSLGAVMLLPKSLSAKDFNLIPQTVCLQDFKVHPLCYFRGDVNSVMTMLPSYRLIKSLECFHQLHMLDNNGLPLDTLIKKEKTKGFLGLNALWAWIVLLLRLQENPLPEYKHLTAGMEGMSKLTPVQIHQGLRSILEMMSYALFMCLGLESDILASIDEDSMQRWVDINAENSSSQCLLPYKVEFSDAQVLMCETHQASWKVAQLQNEPYTNLPGIYHQFVYSLALANNQLEEIPLQLFTSMPNLKDLSLAENKLKVIPPEIGICTKLTNLAVNNNLLSDLPESLGNCQELIRLDLSRNIFERIPKPVLKLRNLQRLFANYLLLSELPENIGDLSNLQILSLNGNCLTTLPDSMRKLQKLINLTLSGVCWLKVRQNVLSREHFEEFLNSNNLVHWLERHNQNKQSIFSLFDEDVNGTLDPKEMGKLNATMFKVFPRFGYKGRKAPDEETPSGFPKVILELKSLQYLAMQYQGLVSIPEEISRLTSLETIHLGNNPNLLTVPAQLGGLKLKRLDLDGCPLLKTPPREIYAKGFITTYAYLKRLLSGSVSCQRTKLMLVGLGGAGKTSLVKALLSTESRTELTIGEEITDGIDICNWTVSTPEGNITYSVWDFAGQTVYYNTHQFFLTDRAVYFLMWNIRLGHEHGGLDFWLSSIKVHAPKAPIIVVGTHLDQVSKVELPMKEMQSKFPQICGFHFVSSHTGQGIKALQEHMTQVTLTQSYMGEKIPGVWLTFEENLKSIEGRSVIEFKELEKRANRSGIFDDNDIRQAVQFLHELGSLQYFTTAGLKTHVVINPQWIVDVMACVVSVKDSPIKQGRFKHADVAKVWSDYEPALHTWMLHLTEEFDLTFPLKDQPINLVPCLLPEKKPEFEWPELGTGVFSKETKMVYKFDYLPAGLFNRAQVRLHQFSDSDLIWKRGSYLKKNGHICLLFQTRDLQLTVKAIGPRPENILFLVHEVFETLIIESFKGINYDFSVPCPDCLKLNLKDPHMFAASIIRRASELKAPFLQCLKYFHTISITDLHVIMPPDTHQDFDLHLVQAVRGMKELQNHLASDIFVSYCPLDVGNTESKSVSPTQLCKDLEKLGYKCWIPNISKPHSLDEMAKALQEAKIFMVFMSNSFVKDENCCNLFKYARLTLKKRIVLIAVGLSLEWRQSSMGILTSDEVYINMMSQTSYAEKFKELATMLQEKHSLKKMKKKVYPPCFISYCWQNSAQAVAKGSRTTDGAVGYGDPRDIKEYLESNGVPCWIDVERVGLHGLFEDIGEGLLNSKVIVVCMSDQYAASDNCCIEFRYGANTLKLPVVLAVVGTGNKWRASEVGIMSLNYSLVSFQENSETSMKRMLDLVKNQLPEQGDGADKNKKETTDENKVEKEGTQKKQKLSLQELSEMAQRKFLRQVNQYAELEDSAPYPNIMLVDFLAEEKGQIELPENQDKNKDQEKRDSSLSSPEKENKFKSAAQSLPPSRSRSSHHHAEFYDQKFGVSLLCEHEEGWHVYGEPLPLDTNFGHSLEKFLPYIARVTVLARYSRKLTLNILSSDVGRRLLHWMEENPKVTATSDFHESFQALRQLVQKADVTNSMGSLKRCVLPNGKQTWLCPTHRSSMRVSLLEAKESVASMHAVSESIGVDLMVTAMREMDFGFLPPRFVKDPDTSDEIDGPIQAIQSSASGISTEGGTKTGATLNQSDIKQADAQKQQQQQVQETPQRRQLTRMNSKSRACLVM